ncbi:hypothetical protein B0T13DRAFT_445326 [Neurospora crassa]|nr:hypothetical protein B0T13DRAFT_445326 [Neurospora crassa]
MIPDILGTRPAGMVYLSSQFPVPGVKHEVTLKMGARLTTTDGTIPNAKHAASGNSLRDIEDERHSNKRTDEVITNGYIVVHDHPSWPASASTLPPPHVSLKSP